MRVAALYDVHGMPWALEAVLAEVGRGRDRLRRRLHRRPVPRRDARARSRSLDAIVRPRELRAHRRATGTASARPRTTRVAAVAAAVRSSSTASSTATRRPTDEQPMTTASTPDEIVAATFARTHRHGRDRPHAPPVRPARRRPARRQRGLRRHGLRGRRRRVLDARRGRRAALRAHAVRRRARRGAGSARATGRTREEFVAENLLVAGLARGGDRGASRRGE